MTTHLSNYLEEKGGKCLEGEKNAFALGKSGSHPSVELSEAKAALRPHWEAPVGQTEMLWFPFKMLLYLGN